MDGGGERDDKENLSKVTFGMGSQVPNQMGPRIMPFFQLMIQQHQENLLTHPKQTQMGENRFMGGYGMVAPQFHVPEIQQHHPPMMGGYGMTAPQSHVPEIQQHLPPIMGGYGMAAPQFQVPQIQPRIQQHHPPMMSFPPLTTQYQQCVPQQILEKEEVHELKKPDIPLARIKKIMKSDENVKNVAADSLVFLAKACEMFISDLTLKSWIEKKRIILQEKDIAHTVHTTTVFDFLVDLVPPKEPKEGETSA